MVKNSTKILCFLSCIVITFAIFLIVLKSLIFGIDHILFSAPLLLLLYIAITVPFNKKIIKKHFSENWKKYVFPIVVYLYIAWISGAPILLEKVFVVASPVTILFDESGKSNTPVDQNFKFPFWKTIGIRLWHDLPIHKKPFLRVHYIVKAAFYHSDVDQNDIKRAVHSSKIVTNIFKNLGDKPLIFREAKKIGIQRTGGDPINASKSVNDYIKKQPIILYPLEELVIFDAAFACTGETINIETKIEYSEYPEQMNVFEFYQTDRVKFDNNSPRILSVETIKAKNELKK